MKILNSMLMLSLLLPGCIPLGNVKETTSPPTADTGSPPVSANVQLEVSWIYSDAQRLGVELVVRHYPLPRGFQIRCPITRLDLRNKNETLNLYLNPEQISLDEFYAISQLSHWYCVQTEDGDGFADYLFSLTHFYVNDSAPDLTQSTQLLVDLGEVIATNSASAITLPFVGSFELSFEVKSGASKLTWLNPGHAVANAVSVEINWVAMNPSVTWLNSCLEMQDHHFWKPRAELVYQDRQAYSTGLFPTYPYPFDRETTLRSTKRCYSFSIPFATPLGSPGYFQAGIDQVQIENTDSGVITAQDCETVKGALEKSHPGLEIRCTTFELQGETQHWFEVLSHPVSISDQEAYALVESAFIQTIAGPWYVEISLE